MGNKKWNKMWKEHLNGLYALQWLPSNADSIRVKEIVNELVAIVDRNTTKDSKEVLE